MKYHFPAQNQGYTYLQTNRSDDLGSIWSSMSLDFQSNLGTMRVGPKLVLGTSTADDSDLGCPIGFRYFDDKFWTVAGTRVFSNNGTPNGAFTEDASANAQTDYDPDESDIETYNGRLWTTTTDALCSKSTAAGAWNSTRMTLNTGYPHLMTAFKKFNRLYVTDLGSQIKSIDSSDVTATSAGDYFIQLGNTTTNIITSIRASSTSIWIGTTNISNRAQRGVIYQWDGISAQATNAYELDANGCMAIAIDNDIPYAMDSNGVLLKFTGSAFEEIGRLPVSPAQKLLKNTGSIDNNRFIHPNGLLVTRNETFLALVNNENNDNGETIQENFPSGIFEFSKDFGFTHKHACSYINPGTAFAISDYGQNRISRAGGLANSNVYVSSPSSGKNGTILAGATYFFNATQTNSGIFYDDSNNLYQKKGYFVTTWFNSQEIQDKWVRLWAVYRRLLNSNDSIVFKYRMYEEDPTYATITWVSTTSFTTTTDVTAYGPTATGFNGTVGGEVEFIQGDGSGACAHITNIANNAGTYTVTVDETITGVTATRTAKARFQKWIKMNPTVTGQVLSYTQMGFDGSAVSNPRIQIKGCMTFTGDDEFHKLALFSNEDIKITA